jgi:hypothetical protein
VIQNPVVPSQQEGHLYEPRMIDERREIDRIIQEGLPNLTPGFQELVA